LLVETFTDPARHSGACYRAANFVLAGETSGFARRNGVWVYHGGRKLCWVYPLRRRGAAGVLAAGFDHPLLHSGQGRRQGVADLNRVVIDGPDGLYARLAAVGDHRKPKGVRHSLASILVVCVVAMLAGATGPTGIAEWAADLPDELRARLRLRRSPMTGRLVAPSLSTIQRALRSVDAEALDRVVCEVLAEQVRSPRTAADGTDDVVGDDDRAGGGDGGDGGDGGGSGGGGSGGGGGDGAAGVEAAVPLLGVAVDGKSLRGARQADGRAVHLLAAMTHEDRVVIAQQEVDHKTNEIKLFRPLLANLDLAGCLVTADALHAQDAHARFLVEEKNAEFLLFVKGNQPSLYNEIVCTPPGRFGPPHVERSEGHGRIECRTARLAATPGGLVEFPHVAAVVRIDREVTDAKSGQARSTETAWAVTSASPRRAGPARIATAARDHWGIEVRHEAPWNRAEVKGLRHRAVAAAR